MSLQSEDYLLEPMEKQIRHENLFEKKMKNNS